MALVETYTDLQRLVPMIAPLLVTREFAGRAQKSAAAVSHVRRP